MARLRQSNSAVPRFRHESNDSLYRDPSTPPVHQRSPQNTSPNSNSDKENRQSAARSKSASLAPSNPSNRPNPAKRRRLEALSESIESDPPQDVPQYAASSVELENADENEGIHQAPDRDGDSPMADEAEDDDEDDEDEDDDHQQQTPSQPAETLGPYQNESDRRRLRREMRELGKTAQDQRNEWMAPDSKGLYHAVQKSDTLFRKVKQTSDATIDSHFLVDAGDMTYKKSRSINVGDSSQGIDIEEFVGKCITFMRNSGETSQTQTSGIQRRRIRDAERDSDDEEGLDQGDALDWAWLGTRACLASNSRPPVPTFLLGPLSVQKRVRKFPVRRAANQRDTQQTKAVEAKEMHHSEIQRSESSDLTNMCSKIWQTLGKKEHMQRDTYTDSFRDGMSEGEERQLRDGLALCEDGGLSLFKSAINPRSFGQTIENLFYISFLVRDGRAELKTDAEGVPSLREYFICLLS